MRKDEYLRELSIALEGRVSEEEAAAAAAGCEAAFEEGIREGKTEEEISAQLGSPAKRSRSILESGQEESILEAWQEEPTAPAAGEESACGESADGQEQAYGPRQGKGYGDHSGQSRGNDPYRNSDPHPASAAENGAFYSGQTYGAGGPHPGEGSYQESGPFPGGGSYSGNGENSGNGPQPGYGAPGDRQYTDFQKKVNRTASDLSGRLGRVNPEVAKRDLASMGTRLGAYILDSLLAFFLVLILTVFFVFVMNGLGGHGTGMHWLRGLGEVNDSRMFMYSLGKGLMYNALPTMFSGIYRITALGLGGIATLSTLCVWLTNGYTPGKWLLRIRIVKLSGEKISFLDALFREALVKGVANSLLKGLLNLGSFIWGCATADQKTVQDLAAQTTVVRVSR